MSMQQFNLFQSKENQQKQKTNVNQEQILGVDYGSGVFHVTSTNDKTMHEKHSHESFLNLNFCKKGDVIVIENGHLQARNQERKISRAQPYTFSELEHLKKNAKAKGVEIRLFPQSQTLRYRSTYFPGQSKSDKIDAQTLGLAASQIGIKFLQKFNPRECNEWTSFEHWMFAQIKDMNEILNQYRECPEIANDFCPCIELFEKHYFTIHRCFEEQYNANAFSSNVYNDSKLWLLSKKRKIGESSASVLIALWCSLVDWNGNIRVFEGKQLSVNKTWSQLLQNKPNHFRGGIARSNIWHWGFKAGVLGAEFHQKNLENNTLPRDLNDKKFVKFKELRIRYTHACKAVLRSMQSATKVC